MALRARLSSRLRQMNARTLAIAYREFTHKRNDPKVWLTSIESFAKILSNKNRIPVNLIIEKKPDSMAELAALPGRAKSYWSRTLHTLERNGLVKLKKDVRG